MPAPRRSGRSADRIEAPEAPKAAASPAKTTPAKGGAARTLLDLVVTAVTALGDRNGSTLPRIVQYLEANQAEGLAALGLTTSGDDYDGDASNALGRKVAQAVKRGVDTGVLARPKGEAGPVKLAAGPTAASATEGAGRPRRAAATAADAKRKRASLGGDEGASHPTEENEDAEDEEDRKEEEEEEEEEDDDDDDDDEVIREAAQRKRGKGRGNGAAQSKRARAEKPDEDPTGTDEEGVGGRRPVRATRAARAKVAADAAEADDDDDDDDDDAAAREGGDSAKEDVDDSPPSPPKRRRAAAANATATAPKKAAASGTLHGTRPPHPTADATTTVHRSQDAIACAGDGGGARLVCPAVLSDDRTKVDTVLTSWADRYSRNRDNAIAELLTLVLEVRTRTLQRRTRPPLMVAQPLRLPRLACPFAQTAGFEAEVTAAQLRRGEPERVLDAVQASPPEVADYAVLGKDKKAKTLRKQFVAFWTALVGRFASNPAETLLATVSEWLVPMTSATVRSLRHTATVAVLALQTGLARACAALRRDLAVTAQKRGAGKGAAAAAAAAAPATEQEVEAAEAHLEKTWQHLLQTYVAKDAADACTMPRANQVLPRPRRAVSLGRQGGRASVAGRGRGRAPRLHPGAGRVARRLRQVDPGRQDVLPRLGTQR